MTHFLKLTIFTILLSFQLTAQIPNPSFETLDSNGAITSWINIWAFSIGLNDSIITDGPMISASTQAHSGLYALELRNSYNVTQNTPYLGQVFCNLPDTNTYQGFTTTVPINFSPYAFEFYYRFTQNPFNDTTLCVVNILNSDLYPLGKAYGFVWDVDSIYKSKLMPIQYFTVPAGNGDSIPAFFRISFVNLYNGIAAIHVGQRILIDDASFILAPTTIPNISRALDYSIWPNPTTNSIYINPMNNYFTHCQIKDALGSIVYSASYTPSIRIGNLPKGIYTIGLSTKNGIGWKKIIKE